MFSSFKGWWVSKVGRTVWRQVFGFVSAIGLRTFGVSSARMTASFPTSVAPGRLFQVEMLRESSDVRGSHRGQRDGQPLRVRPEFVFGWSSLGPPPWYSVRGALGEWLGAWGREGQTIRALGDVSSQRRAMFRVLDTPVESNVRHFVLGVGTPAQA